MADPVGAPFRGPHTPLSLPPPHRGAFRRLSGPQSAIVGPRTPVLSDATGMSARRDGEEVKSEEFKAIEHIAQDRIRGKWHPSPSLGERVCHRISCGRYRFRSKEEYFGRMLQRYSCSPSDIQFIRDWIFSEVKEYAQYNMNPHDQRDSENHNIYCIPGFGVVIEIDQMKTSGSNKELYLVLVIPEDKGTIGLPYEAVEYRSKTSLKEELTGMKLAGDHPYIFSNPLVFWHRDEDPTKESMVVPKAEGDLLKYISTNAPRFLNTEECLRNTLQYLLEVAEAIAYMHNTQGVLHRDIKLDNILIEGGHAKLADLSSAMKIEELRGRYQDVYNQAEREFLNACEHNPRYDQDGKIIPPRVRLAKLQRNIHFQAIIKTYNQRFGRGSSRSLDYLRYPGLEELLRNRSARAWRNSDLATYQDATTLAGFIDRKLRDFVSGTPAYVPQRLLQDRIQDRSTDVHAFIKTVCFAIKEIKHFGGRYLSDEDREKLHHFKIDLDRLSQEGFGSFPTIESVKKLLINYSKALSRK